MCGKIQVTHKDSYLWQQMETGLFCLASIFGGRNRSYLLDRSLFECKDKEIGSDLPMFFGVPSDSQIIVLTELSLLSLLNGQ